jgi:hypothetical protein
MPLMNCPDCEREISESAVSCIHCGRPMGRVVQKNSAITSKAIFCGSCGESDLLRTLESIVGSDTSNSHAEINLSGSVQSEFRGSDPRTMELSGTMDGFSASTTAQTIYDAIETFQLNKKKRTEFLGLLFCQRCNQVTLRGKASFPILGAAKQIANEGKIYSGNLEPGSFLRIQLEPEEVERIVRKQIKKLELKQTVIGSCEEITSQIKDNGFEFCSSVDKNQRESIISVFELTKKKSLIGRSIKIQVLVISGNRPGIKLITDSASRELFVREVVEDLTKRVINVLKSN